jgi:6,7-dimethyl-8-ribityllumazine synthase
MASRDASPSFSELPDGSSFKFGIVVSQWNHDITDALLAGAKDTLLKAKVKEENIEVLSVPGSFELPWGARQLMKADKKDGIICLGCLIQGETKHDEYIAQAVANGIMQLSIMSGLPVIWCTDHPYCRASKRTCRWYSQRKGSGCRCSANGQRPKRRIRGKEKIGFDIQAIFNDTIQTGWWRRLAVPKLSGPR